MFSAGRRAKRGGVAIVHDSGAERALVADLAHELGVEFADLAPDTLTAIGGMLDDGLAATNPLDVWGTGADTRNLFGACLRAMVDDPAVAVTALAVDLVTEFDGDTAYADAVIDVAKHTDAPIAVLASVASAIDRADRGDGCGTAGFRCSKARAAGWRRSGTSPAGRCPSTVPTPQVKPERRERWMSRMTGEVSPFGAAGRLRRAGGRRPDSRFGRYGAGGRRGCRLSGRAENRWRPAQERCRRRRCSTSATGIA